MQAISVLTVIGVIFFMIINLVIYHKIFTVTYFNLGKGCFTELFFAWLAAMLEVGLITSLGGKVLKLLGAAGKVLLIVLAIVFVIFVVCKIVQMIKENIEKTSKPDNGSIQNNQEMDEKKESGGAALKPKEATRDVGVEEEGKKNDIELEEVGAENAGIIKVVHETISPSLAEAKDFVESSAETLKRISREQANDIKIKLEAEGAKVIMKLSQEQEKQDNIHVIACTGCGKMINRDANFCAFCGNKIIKVDKSVCVNCGKPITESSNFCHYCGEKITKNSGYD